MDFKAPLKYILLCSILFFADLAFAAASSAQRPNKRAVKVFKRQRSKAIPKTQQKINLVIPIPNYCYIQEHTVKPTLTFGKSASSSKTLKESSFRTVEKTFKFFEDKVCLSAYLNIRAKGGPSINAIIHIPLDSMIPEYKVYTVFSPISLGKSLSAVEALKNAKKYHPKWNPDVATLIKTFFKEFSSPEEIKKGIEWERTIGSKELIKKALQFFDTEVDAIIHDHNQHIMR